MPDPRRCLNPIVVLLRDELYNDFNAFAEEPRGIEPARPRAAPGLVFDRSAKSSNAAMKQVGSFRLPTRSQGLPIWGMLEAWWGVPEARRRTPMTWSLDELDG